MIMAIIEAGPDGRGIVITPTTVSELTLMHERFKLVAGDTGEDTSPNTAPNTVVVAGRCGQKGAVPYLHIERPEDGGKK